MHSISDIIASVPDVIWGVILASLLTFIGVLLTNRGYVQRQRESQAHEARKFQFEHNMVLKKEVYFEMAAMFARILGSFPRLTDLEFSHKEISAITSDPEEAAGKALLIAGEDTVSKLREYTIDLSEAFFQLIKQRELLLAHSKAIVNYQEIIAGANAEKDRLLTILKESNMQGRNDIYTITYIEDNYRSQEGVIAAANNDIAEHKAVFDPLHKAFVKNCWAEYTRLSVAMAPVIIAVRNELDSGIDAGKFEEIMQKSTSRIVAMMNKVVPEEEDGKELSKV